MIFTAIMNILSVLFLLIYLRLVKTILKHSIRLLFLLEVRSKAGWCWLSLNQLLL